MGKYTLNQFKAVKQEIVSLYKAGKPYGEACLTLIKMAEAKREEIGRPFSMSECEKYVGIHFCVDHTAKMAGMYSLSTMSGMNENCERNAKVKGSICEHCFARAMEQAGRTGKDSNILTTLMLKTVTIPRMLFPKINALYFRLESFGDLQNVRNFKNYITFVNENPDTKFAEWTKCPWIMKEYFDKSESRKKPANLKIIYSGLMMNELASLERIQERYPFIDKTFSVFESEEMASIQGLAVNCGKSHCLSCKKCYANDYVNELIEVLKRG